MQRRKLAPHFNEPTFKISFLLLKQIFNKLKQIIKIYPV